MRLFSRSTLRVFWETLGHQDAEQALRAWADEAENAAWSCPQDIKDQYGSASFAANNRVVFNI